MRRLSLIICIALAACGRAPELDRSVLHPNPDTQGSSSSAPEDNLRIYAIDVGQGDATLVVAPTGEAILIDAGPAGAGAKVLALLDSAGVGELDAIIATHFHEDHTGGVPEVIGRLAGKGYIYDRGDGGTQPDGESFDIYERTAGDRRKGIHPGQRIALGDAHLEVLAAGGLLADGTKIDPGEPPDENTESIVLMIEYQGFRMLAAADITGGGGDPPYQTPDVETPLAKLAGDVDVLRVAHHGSKTSTNAAFIEETRPEVAIVSVGDDNDYHHPSDEVVERLIAAGASVFLTERGWSEAAGPVISGDIEIDVSADGSYSVR